MRHRGLTLGLCWKERKLALQGRELADAVGGGALVRPRLRWWREVLTIGIFYELYSLARNSQGSASTSPTHAFRNARVVINLERALGLYHEESIQRLFLHARPLVMALNVYYGTAHFLVTAGVLMWMFLRHPERYARWRWALACTTLLALVGFLAFPLMPPRLISGDPFFMGSYEDTLHTIGGLWNFEDGAIAKLSNQYAAMPSLHFAWSLWCCLALWPNLRSMWSRTLAVAHPLVTLVAIVATANHYWLDALGGAFALLLGWLLGGLLCTRASRVATWPRMPARRTLRPARATGGGRHAAEDPGPLGPPGAARTPAASAPREPGPAPREPETATRGPSGATQVGEHAAAGSPGRGPADGGLRTCDGQASAPAAPPPDRLAGTDGEGQAAASGSEGRGRP